MITLRTDEGALSRAISLVPRALGAVRRLLAARAGTAAVEFAIVMPVAIILYMGAAEVASGVMASRKLSALTHTLADLTSQQPTSSQSTSTSPPQNAMTPATLSTLMTAAATLMAPQQTTTLNMTVSAIDLVNNTSTGLCCQATVRWSYTQGGTLRPCKQNGQTVYLTAGTNGATNQPTTLPAALMPTGVYLPSPVAIIVADTNYTYQPVVGSGYFSFAPVMARNAYMFPRTTGQVVINGTLPASGTQYGQVCY